MEGSQENSFNWFYFSLSAHNSNKISRYTSKNNLQELWISGGYTFRYFKTWCFLADTLWFDSQVQVSLYLPFFNNTISDHFHIHCLHKKLKAQWLYTADQVETWPGWAFSELTTGLSQTPSIWDRRKNRETKDVMFLLYSITPSYWSRTSACLPGLSGWAQERYCWLLKDFPLLSSGYWLVPDTQSMKWSVSSLSGFRYGSPRKVSLEEVLWFGCSFWHHAPASLSGCLLLYRRTCKLSFIDRAREALGLLSFLMDSNSMLTHHPIKFLSSFPNQEKEAPSYFWFADFNTD